MRGVWGLVVLTVCFVVFVVEVEFSRIVWLFLLLLLHQGVWLCRLIVGLFHGLSMFVVCVFLFVVRNAFRI